MTDIKNRLREKRDKLQAQWSLFLAVGNGGFLTAIGSKVLDALADQKAPDGSALVELCVPLIFIFSAGLICAALIPLFELVATNRLLTQTTDVEEAADKHWGKLWNWTPEILAASFFVGGVAYGAWTLSQL
jgi:hypothetical protein